jgi:hypothetical protein
MMKLNKTLAPSPQLPPFKEDTLGHWLICNSHASRLSNDTAMVVVFFGCLMRVLYPQTVLFLCTYGYYGIIYRSYLPHYKYKQSKNKMLHVLQMV